MSQQINLLNPALIKKSEFLNPNNIALLLGILLLGLLAYYQFESNALAKLKASHEQSVAQVTEMETSLKQIQAAKAAQSNSSSLLNTISTLEQKKMTQEAIIHAASKSNAQSSKSYAALLKAFSKQSVEGLWITGLSIDQDAEALSIKGRALHADLLPAFIARLRAEPALKGKTFTDLKMHNAIVKAENVIKANADNQAVNPANNKVLGNSAQEKTNDQTFIEFTLHSVNEEETKKLTSSDAVATVGVTH